MGTFAERLNVYQVDPKATEAVLALENYVRQSGLETPLYELIKIRASQMNGCAYCLDMHTKDAVKGGEDQRRINILSAWREAPSFFTERERAALALTEEVTAIGERGVSGTVWDEVAKHFTEQELVHLLMAISAINVWNRLAVATHQKLPGQPAL